MLHQMLLNSWQLYEQALAMYMIVADSDDADSVLVVTGVASGNESSNNTIVTNGTGVGSSVTGTYGTLNIAANGTILTQQMQQIILLLALLQPILLHLLPVMMKPTQAHLYLCN